MVSAAQEPKHIVVATHGHCFDGMCSAAMFTRLMTHLHAEPLRFTYLSCGYGPGQNGVDPKVLVGADNVKGNEISFKVARTFNGNTITTTYEGKVDGDTIKGKSTTSGGQQERPARDWEAKREKDAK